MKMDFKSALTYGVGFALLTAFVPQIIPAIFTIPFLGLTIGGIVYYTFGYFLIGWLGRAVKILKD